MTIATAIAMLAVASSPAADPNASSVLAQGGSLQFQQLDLDLDDGFRQNTDWGAAVIDHPGFPEVMYFNLTVNGRWEVQNMAILSQQGVGRPNRNTFYFNLRVPLGQRVGQIPMGALLTPDPQFAAPPVTDVAPVGRGVVAQRSGYPGGAIEYRPPQGQRGGAGVGEMFCHKDFPNQECGPNQCAPAAVSNSLLWLKRKHNVDIDEALLALARMLQVLPFNPNNGTRLDWPTFKDNYLKQFKHIWKVDTDVKEADDINKLEAWIKAGYDVEIDVAIPGREVGHCVAIVGVKKNADGTYQVDYVDDADQLRPGGTEGVKSITVAGDGTVTSGTPSIPTGSRILRFVVEKVTRVNKVAKNPNIVE